MRSGFLFLTGLLVASTPARASSAAGGDSATAPEPWQIEKTAPHPAATPEPPREPESTYFPCVFVPRPSCRDYPLLELSLAGGESRSYVGWQWALRGTAELGGLVAATPRFHVGPVVEVGFDKGRITSGWSVVPKVRGRLWLGQSNFTLEGSTGFLIEHYAFHDGEENRYRIGVAADLSFSYHGAGSLLASLSMGADPGGIGGAEVRLLVGFRASLLVWGIIAVAPLAAYGAK